MFKEMKRQICGSPKQTQKTVNGKPVYSNDYQRMDEQDIEAMEEYYEAYGKLQRDMLLED